jgi:hypothetical protein
MQKIMGEAAPVASMRDSESGNVIRKEARGSVVG